MIDWSQIRLKLMGSESKFALPPHIKLPVMPTAVLEFLQKSENPDAKTKDLSRIIETDSGLTAELLRYVNSSAFGMRKKIATVDQTLALLGIKKTKLFLMTSGVQQSMRSRESRYVNMQNFWIANLERAIFAREVAMLFKTDPDLAFAGGMLLDLLLPIITNEMHAEYAGYFDQLALAEHPDLHNYEREKFRWDHACAGAHVLHGWGFPDELVCAVYMHTQGIKIMTDPVLGSSVVASVTIAAQIPDACQQVVHGLEQLVKLEAVWPKFNLLEIAHKVQQDFEQMSPSIGHMTLLKRVEKMLVDQES
jgi:serine/threonine-protein kinase